MEAYWEPPPVKPVSMDAAAVPLPYGHLVVAVSGPGADAIFEALPVDALARCATPATLFTPRAGAHRAGVHVARVGYKGAGEPLMVASSKPGTPAFKKGCLKSVLKTVRPMGTGATDAVVALAVVKLGAVEVRRHRVTLTGATGAVGVTDPLARWVTFALEDCLGRGAGGSPVATVELRSVGGMATELKVPGMDDAVARCLRGRVGAGAKGTPVTTTFTVKTVVVFRVPGTDAAEVAAAAVGLSTTPAPKGLGSTFEESSLGTGKGGGGVGVGTIGLGTIGTIGKGTGGGGSTGLGMGKGVGYLGSRKDPATVKFGMAVVKGSLEKDIIRRVVRSRSAEVKYCYEKELLRSPGLGGKLVIRFVIAATGSVAMATVAEDSVGSAAVGSCLASKVKGWLFPKPMGGGIVDVRFPFIFDSGSPEKKKKKKKKKKGIGHGGGP